MVNPSHRTFYETGHVSALIKGSENIANLTRPNSTYNILEQALTDPVYARDLLTRQPLAYGKPNYLPSLVSIINNEY